MQKPTQLRLCTLSSIWFHKTKNVPIEFSLQNIWSSLMSAFIRCSCKSCAKHIDFESIQVETYLNWSMESPTWGHWNDSNSLLHAHDPLPYEKLSRYCINPVCFWWSAYSRCSLLCVHSWSRHQGCFLGAVQHQKLLWPSCASKDRQLDLRDFLDHVDSTKDDRHDCMFLSEVLLIWYFKWIRTSIQLPDPLYLMHSLLTPTDASPQIWLPYCEDHQGGLWVLFYCIGWIHRSLPDQIIQSLIDTNFICVMPAMYYRFGWGLDWNLWSLLNYTANCHLCHSVSCIRSSKRKS